MPALSLRTRICTRLRQLVEREGLSQAALGRRLAHQTGEKWPQPRVWKLLHACLPLTIEILDATAHVLNVSLLDLLAQTALPKRRTSPTAVQLLKFLEREKLLDASVVVLVYAPTKERAKRIRTVRIQPIQADTHDMA